MEQSMVFENISKAKTILLKASKDPKFQKYMTEDKINDALSNIIICNSDEQFTRQIKLLVPDIDKEEFSSLSGLKAFQAVESKKIILRNNCSIETIIHEIIHYLSLNGKDTGVLGIGTELINENNNLDWNTLNPLHIDVLNEAITHYITQELMPEIKVEDAYNYGALFLKDYAEASGNTDKILDAYFGKDKTSLDFIAKDINKEGVISWHDIVEISGVYQYTQMRIFRKFEENFRRCANERKKIDILIERLKQRNNTKTTRDSFEESR